MDAPCLLVPGRDYIIGVRRRVLSLRIFEPIGENDPLHAPCLLEVTIGVSRTAILRKTFERISKCDLLMNILILPENGGGCDLFATLIINNKYKNKKDANFNFNMCGKFLLFSLELLNHLFMLFQQSLCS